MLIILANCLFKCLHIYWHGARYETSRTHWVSYLLVVVFFCCIGLSVLRVAFRFIFFSGNGSAFASSYLL